MVGKIAANTDFSSSEAVCNMFVYIIGEEILQESKHLNECWDVYLSDEDIDAIIDEIELL